jgi:hypothetical protein
VRAKGLSLQGDNDAFGHLVHQRLGLARDATEADAVAAATKHIRMPALCNMNSFGVYVKDGDSNSKGADWYLSDKFYHDGDFLLDMRLGLIRRLWESRCY